MNKRLNGALLHIFRQIILTALLILFSNSVAGAAPVGVGGLT